MDNRDKELEALEAKHLDEASTDAQRSPIDFPRMMRIQHPSCQALPQSNEWLERLYAGDRMPREKKTDGVRPHAVMGSLDGFSRRRANERFGWNESNGDTE